MIFLIIGIIILIFISLVCIFIFHGKKKDVKVNKAPQIEVEPKFTLEEEELMFEQGDDTPVLETSADEESDGDFLDIFIKRSKEERFEGDFVPLTLDQVEQNVKTEIREKLHSIPPLPNVAHELIYALGDEMISSSKISEIASKDPVLVGKLLQLVNSSFFALSTEISSIGRAVVLLGFNTVKNYVIQRQLSKAIPKLERDSFSIEDFWTHSLASSVCAYHMSNKVPDLQKSAISTISLLHDIGKLAMAFYKPDEFKVYIEEIEKEQLEPAVIIEERIFGVNHALVGSLLAENWELPEYIRKVILYHHHPTFVSLDQLPEDYNKAITVVHFSDLISKLCGLGFAGEDVEGVNDEYFEIINSSPPLELHIDQKVSVEIQKAKYFVRTQLGK